MDSQQGKEKSEFIISVIMILLLLGIHDSYHDL